MNERGRTPRDTPVVARRPSPDRWTAEEAAAWVARAGRAGSRSRAGGGETAGHGRGGGGGVGSGAARRAHSGQ